MDAFRDAFLAAYGPGGPTLGPTRRGARVNPDRTRRVLPGRRVAMAEDEVALMQQLHDEHADVLWRFCLRLVGQRPGPRRGRRPGDAAARLAAPHGAREPARRPSARGCSPWPATSSSTTGAAAAPQPETPVAEVPEQRREDDDGSDQLLLSWVVAEALTHLSEDHRAVLLECYYRGRPVAEAARRLGIPEGTVKSRTHYALRALKLALEEMGVSA